MIREEEVYKIGKIGKPHGVKGEVTFTFDDDIFDRVDAEYLILRIDGILVPFFMEEYRFRTDESALVKFCDIDTQERARELTNCEVFFPRQLADDDVEHLSWAQIIGYRLIDDNTGAIVGEIHAIDDSTINMLFEVVNQEGKEILIPASEELITEINTQHREIHANLPEGLLEL